jgi:dTDP-glucose pyrophosphorylase
MTLKESLQTMVVLCAGSGKRMMHGEHGKPHVVIAGKPLLRHAVDPWSKSAMKWVFVASPEDDRIKPLVESLNADAEIVLQQRPSGMTDALLVALPRAGRRFTVLLGDCIVKGKFNFDVPCDCGVGVFNGASSEDIKNNYGVVVQDRFVHRAFEKPRDAAGLMCGMGTYFFNPELTDFFETTARDHDAQIHMTTILDLWANACGKQLSAVRFTGEYINVNTEQDIVRAYSIVVSGDR